MISHDHKCIFIHIPRTGGSSFEKVIFGMDWFAHKKETKHLIASQAKEIYKEYWNDYFKFAIVRNPWDRCVSMLNFSKNYYGYEENFFKKKLTKKKLEWYKNRYNYPFTIEYDYRFYSISEVINERHSNNQVYLNILDEELDYVGKFENLHDDFKEVSKILGLNKQELPILAESKNRKKNYRDYYTSELKEIVENVYAKDIQKFNYSF